MHIAYFSPAWPPGGGANGIVTYVRIMVAAMRGLGHRVTVITREECFVDDVRVQEDDPRIADRLLRQASKHLDFRFGHLPIAGRRLSRRLAALHRLDPFDILEMEETFGHIGQVARAGPKAIARLHGPAVLSAAWLCGSRTRRLVERDAAERWALTRVAGITAPALPTLARIEDAYGLDGTREVIPNPVECAASSWHPPAGPKRLLWVGKVNLAKGIDRLLATFEQLAQSDRNIWLDVVGPEGEPGPDGRVLRMEELTAAMPETARRRVCYHGLATPAQIARLRAGSMLTLITSRSEVFPYACFEAAAAGQAVLAMRWPGADRIIQDGVTGILTDEHPSALAAEVCSLLSNPGRLITLGAEARKEVERTLSPTVIAARTTAFYERVLHGSTLQASR